MKNHFKSALYFALFLCFFLSTTPLEAKSEPPAFSCLSKEQQEDFKRYLEVRKAHKIDMERARWFAMPDDVDFMEVTDRVHRDKIFRISEKDMKKLKSSGRRFFLFKYPSDGLKIIGFISFVPKALNPKTILLVRGGNRSFGLPTYVRPSYTRGNHIYVGSTLRGAINPGRDEFGGADTEDIVNLVRYFPTLSSKIGLDLDASPLYGVGISRGAMELFLALSRSPWLQGKMKKALSVVGLLDMNEVFKDRPDMVSMFYRYYRLTSFNKEIWIKDRNPLEHVHKIRRDLPILLIQGDRDIRVKPVESRNMYRHLKHLNHAVTYWEEKGLAHRFDGIIPKVEAWMDQ